MTDRDAQPAPAGPEEPREGLHTLLWPPHPGDVYQSSALCSCGDFQYDANYPSALFSAMRSVQRAWTAHAFATTPAPDEDSVLGHVATPAPDTGAEERLRAALREWAKNVVRAVPPVHIVDTDAVPTFKRRPDQCIDRAAVLLALEHADFEDGS